MDEAIAGALREAGDVLSEAVRTALIMRGLPHDLTTSVVDRRVTIDSRAREAHPGERRGLLAPPSAPVEAAVQLATAEILSVLQRRLQEELR